MTLPCKIWPELLGGVFGQQRKKGWDWYVMVAATRGDSLSMAWLKIQLPTHKQGREKKFGGEHIVQNESNKEGEGNRSNNKRGIEPSNDEEAAR